MRLMMTALALYLTALSPQSAPGGPAPDAWKPLRFLLGNWDAQTIGGSAGAQSSGTYTFALELQGHVLARHSRAADCAGPVNYDCQHGDLLYVYPGAAPGTYRAIFFDTEGHVINYMVTTPETDTVVMLSEATAPGPQFRLRYELKTGAMTGHFEMRAPGAAEFRPYLEWSGRARTNR